MFFRRKKKAGEDASTNKYNNKKVTALGRTWDSTKEYERYLVLKEAEDKGIITDLEIQPKFELIPAVYKEEIVHLKTKDKVVKKCVQLPINYIADFRYKKDGVEVVEDTKAGSISKKTGKVTKVLTDKYVLKKKMMFALKGIEIREVYSATEEI